VLLKDVFDYSILEIADLVGSTPGGVKAALNRGRTKLATLPPETSEPVVAGSELSKLLQLYVDGFNRRDWSGVRDLISADAQLLFANGYAGKVRDSEYFGKYETSPIIWRMAAGTVDGEPVVIIMQQEADGWKSKSVIRLEMVGGEVVRVTDYLFCPWVLLAAKSVVVGATS
jgi:RNA polymerase sigma-70 factor (ECF subfamily)